MHRRADSSQTPTLMVLPRIRGSGSRDTRFLCLKTEINYALEDFSNEKKKGVLLRDDGNRITKDLD